MQSRQNVNYLNHLGLKKNYLLAPLAILVCLPLLVGCHAPRKGKQQDDYGVVETRPILLGGTGPISATESEHIYLRHLRDEANHPVSFQRLGSAGPGPDGHTLDLYEVTTTTGKTYRLYLD